VYSNYTVAAIKEEANRGPNTDRTCPIDIEEINFFLKDYSMKPDMLTVAKSGTSSQKLVSQHWTVWTFIGSSVGIMAVTGVTFCWIVFKVAKLPNTSGVLEADILGLVGRDGALCEKDDEYSRIGELATTKDLGKELFSSFRKRRLRLLEVENADQVDDGSLVLAMIKDRAGQEV
jgi:hypothetical protein